MALGWKLAVGGVAAALCAVVLRRHVPELAAALALAAGAWLLLSVSGALGGVLALMKRLVALSGVGEGVFLPVARVVGVAILTHVSGELCRSAGEGGIAAFLQTAGTALALAASVPLVEQVLTVIEGLIA